MNDDVGKLVYEKHDLGPHCGKCLFQYHYKKNGDLCLEHPIEECIIREVMLS